MFGLLSRKTLSNNYSNTNFAIATKPIYLLIEFVKENSVVLCPSIFKQCPLKFIARTASECLQQPFQRSLPNQPSKVDPTRHIVVENLQLESFLPFQQNLFRPTL